MILALKRHFQAIFAINRDGDKIIAEKTATLSSN